MPATTGRHVLIAGAGEVGRRAAAVRVACGDRVFTLRRGDGAAVDGARALRADLATGDGLHRLPRGIDAVIYAAAPDRRDDDAYRALFVDGPQRLLDALGGAPTRFVFVSSTAVYGEDDGKWVDETTPPLPPRHNGVRLLQAEQRLHAALGDAAIAMRCSGIYGPGRTALLRRALGDTPARTHWTNRIHVDDVAGALSHLLDVAHPAPLYLASDDTPALESELWAWLRQQLGRPAIAAAIAPVTGRRIGNRLLRASGWVPRYRDYHDGYATVLAELPTTTG